MSLPQQKNIVVLQNIWFITNRVTMRQKTFVAREANVITTIILLLVPENPDLMIDTNNEVMIS